MEQQVAMVFDPEVFAIEEKQHAIELERELTVLALMETNRTLIARLMAQRPNGRN